jgi:hypothetical protein
LIVDFSHEISFFVRAVGVVNLFRTENNTRNAAVVWEVDKLLVVDLSQLIKFLFRREDFRFRLFGAID